MRVAGPRGSSNRILVLGGGFGGVYAALELEKVLARRDDLDVTLVTRDNFFLFTPMLHEVAACDLELGTIAKDFACVTTVAPVAQARAVRAAS
jgi:NADH dehydrogenase FAD-containing subunit